MPAGLARAISPLPSCLSLLRETEAAIAKCKDVLKVFGLREEN